MRSRLIQGGNANDRLPSCNPTARNSASPLPEMPNTHDAYAHPAGAYRIRTSHVRLLQMRSRRTSRDTFRSDGIRCGWLVHWRTTAAEVTGTPVSALGVGFDPRGNLRANTADYQTSRPNVFSAGDIRRGQSLVVWTIRKAPLRPRPRSVSDENGESAAVSNSSSFPRRRGTRYSRVRAKNTATPRRTGYPAFAGYDIFSRRKKRQPPGPARSGAVAIGAPGAASRSRLRRC